MRTPALSNQNIFAVQYVAFQSLRPVVSRKNAGFPLASGRAARAASHFAFFKGKTLYTTAAALLLRFS